MKKAQKVGKCLGLFYKTFCHEFLQKLPNLVTLLEEWFLKRKHFQSMS